MLHCNGINSSAHDYIRVDAEWDLVVGGIEGVKGGQSDEITQGPWGGAGLVHRDIRAVRSGVAPDHSIACGVVANSHIHAHSHHDIHIASSVPAQRRVTRPLRLGAFEDKAEAAWERCLVFNRS